MAPIKTSKLKKKQQRKRQAAVAAPAPRAPTLGPYATVGQDLGALLGFAPLGERVGGAIGRLFGKGDYVVRGNSLMESYGKPAAGPPPPAVFRNGKRGVRIVEREYLGDITSGTLSGSASVFTNQAYPINPGLAGSFPWLSKIARQFDQWEPHGIVYEFRSTSSEYNGTSQALGTIILSTDYDAVDANYTSKVQAENSDYAMSVKSSDCAIHGIECEPGERPTPVLYTRAAERPTGTDARMYDLGNFQICTQGMSVAGVNLGELWVSYDITFYKKQLHDADSPENLGLTSFSTSAAGSTSDYLGIQNAAFRTYGNWNNSAFFAVDKLYFPSVGVPMGAVFQVELFWLASSGTLTAPTLSYNNCTRLTGGALLASNGDGFGPVDISGVGVRTYRREFVRIDAPASYIGMSGGTLANVTYASSVLTELPAQIPYPLTPTS